MTVRAPVPSHTGGEEFRSFFRRHAAGVAIITARSTAGPVGFTASSLASVSSVPPIVSFNVSRTSASWPALQESAYVGVHRLTASDARLAALFARRGADRFGGVRWSRGAFGVPILRGPESCLTARVIQRVQAGDSAVLLAEVLHIQVSEEIGVPERGPRHPLVYATGSYAQALPIGPD